MARPKKQPAEQRVLKCAIYARVSTKEQEEGFSIDAQLGLLRGYATAKGMELVQEYVEAETAKMSGRPEFNRMVKDIQAGQAQAIVVEKTDRIYRNLKDASIIEELDIELHLVKENTVISKNSRSHEKFVHDIKLVVAKNYIDNLSEEASKGMREKAKQGYWPSRAPIGYLNVLKGSLRVIEPDPKNAPLIRRLFELYASGKVSLKSAAKTARTLGLGNGRVKTLNTSSVYIILRNPIYLGLVKWDGETYPGKHEPIIDKETFDRVQDILAGRTVKTPTRGNPEFAYRGIFRCARCGCLMSPYLVKGTYIYYACTGFKGCKRQGLREDAITDQISMQLQGLRIKPEVMEMLRKALRESFGNQKTEHEERTSLLKAERSRLESCLEQLYIDKLAGAVPESAYPALKARWEGEMAEVDIALKACERANIATWDDNVRMLELVSNLPDRFVSASPELRREMLSHLVSNSLIIGQKVQLNFRPWFKLVLEANKKAQENGDKKEQIEKWWAQRDSNL